MEEDRLEEEIEVTAEQEEISENVKEFQIALQQLAIDFGLIGIVAIYASSEDGLLQATQVGQHTDKLPIPCQAGRAPFLYQSTSAGCLFPEW